MAPVIRSVDEIGLQVARLLYNLNEITRHKSIQEERSDCYFHIHLGGFVPKKPNFDVFRTKWLHMEFDFGSMKCSG